MLAKGPPIQLSGEPALSLSKWPAAPTAAIISYIRAKNAGRHKHRNDHLLYLKNLNPGQYAHRIILSSFPIIFSDTYPEAVGLRP
jgi:hypothetical protein